MVFASYAALIIGQGMPFRGMVHDGTLFMQKDPMNSAAAVPVASAKGKNFVAVKYGRSPRVDLFEIDREGGTKLIGDLSKPTQTTMELKTWPNPDGSFWVTARQNENVASPGYMMPYVVLCDANGKIKFQKLFEIDSSDSMIVDNDAKGDLYVLAISRKTAAHRLLRLDGTGRTVWDKTLAVKPRCYAKSMTADSDAHTFVFASPEGDAAVPEGERGFQCFRFDKETGASKDRYNYDRESRILNGAATAWKNIVYAAGQNTRGSAKFYALSANALTVSLSTSVPVEKIRNITAMEAHPKRGIFVGSSNEAFQPAMSMFSFGGKHMWSQNAALPTLRGSVTAIQLDRYSDVYASGGFEGGVFVIKMARSTGGADYRQIVSHSVGESYRNVPIAINNESGDVFTSAIGQVARFSQSPILSAKKVDMIEDETVAGNALDGDRYAAGGEVVIVERPKMGTVKLGKDGRYTYTPKKDFVGRDIFTYRVNKPGVSSYAGAVEIMVAAAPKNKG